MSKFAKSLLNAQPGSVVQKTLIAHPHGDISKSVNVEVEIEIPHDYPNDLPKVKVIGNPPFKLSITDKDGYIIMDEMNGPNFSKNYTIDKYLDDYIITSIEEAL